MNTDTLGRAAQRVADQLVALHARHEAGRITREEFIALALVFLDAARARAVALADVALAAELSRLRRTVVNPVGLEPPPSLTEDVVNGTLDSDPYRLDAVAAVAVLGRAVTLDAAQRATQDGMRAQDVGYWTRVPNTGACEVCEDLADGLVSVDEVMWTHKGCGCAQRPVA